MHEPYLWAIGLKYSLIDGSIFHFKLTLGPLQLKRLVVIYGIRRLVQILIYMFKNKFRNPFFCKANHWLINHWFPFMQPAVSTTGFV